MRCDTRRFCPDCKKQKPLSEFPFRKDRWIYNRRCFDCQNALRRVPEYHFSRWTTEQDAFLLTCVRSGKTPHEVAALTGRSVMAIRKRASNLFLKWAKPVGPRKWTDDRLSGLRDLLRRGLSESEIARKTGETRSAISNAKLAYLTPIFSGRVSCQ